MIIKNNTLTINGLQFRFMDEWVCAFDLLVKSQTTCSCQATIDAIKNHELHIANVNTLTIKNSSSFGGMQDLVTFAGGPAPLNFRAK